jgi:hypothetical protein
MKELVYLDQKGTQIAPKFIADAEQFMQLGMLTFLGAFAGFYLGLAAYLFFRNLLGPVRRRSANKGRNSREIETDFAHRL